MEKIYTCKDLVKITGLSLRRVQQYADGINLEKTSGVFLFTDEHIEDIESKKGKVGQPRKTKETVKK